MPDNLIPVLHSQPVPTGLLERRLASIHAAIRIERRPLPPHDLNGVNYRRWAAAVCGAEARHAAGDFWRAVHALGLAAHFDRDGGQGDHAAPYRYPHEAHAVAALIWLRDLEAHERDRRGPWANFRWETASAEQRRRWLARRRQLWAGFVREVERYREARAAIDSRRAA